MRIHPLSSDIPKPERFTYPFCYEPHPLCLMAAEEVKQEIERIQPTGEDVRSIGGGRRVPGSVFGLVGGQE